MKQHLEQILKETERLLMPAELKAIRKRLVDAGNSKEVLQRELDAVQNAYNKYLIIAASVGVNKDALAKLARQEGLDVPMEADYVGIRDEIMSNNPYTTYNALVLLIRELAGEREKDGIIIENVLKLNKMQEERIADLERECGRMGDQVKSQETQVGNLRRDRDHWKERALKTEAALLEKEGGNAFAEDTEYVEGHIDAPSLKDARELMRPTSTTAGLVDHYLAEAHRQPTSKMLAEVVEAMKGDKRMHLDRATNKDIARALELANTLPKGKGGSAHNIKKWL